MGCAIKTGDVFRVRYPFVRTEYSELTEDGYKTRKSWRPGVDYRLDQYGENADAFAHGEGWQVLTVVSTHKPGKYPNRIFYTQRFEPPTGDAFGKGDLKILSEPAFRRRIAGFGVMTGDRSLQEYRVDPEASSDA